MVAGDEACHIVLVVQKLKEQKESMGRQCLKAYLSDLPPKGTTFLSSLVSWEPNIQTQKSMWTFLIGTAVHEMGTLMLAVRTRWIPRG